MPRGEQVQVILVQVGDRLGVVHRQLPLGDVVHPRAHDLADELAARLAPDRLGDHSYCVLWLDEAKWHRDSRGDCKTLTSGTVGTGEDGTFVRGEFNARA